MEETDLLSLAPSTEVFDAALALLPSGALKQLGRTIDQTLLFGQVEGSGGAYDVSVDLISGKPAFRCNCPSRKRPCKHALAMLIAHLRGAPAFADAEPPAPLLAQRKAPAAASAKPKAPRKTDTAALGKKAKEQLEGLSVAEKLLVDLAGSGLGTQGSKGAEALRERAKQFNDSYLPGLAVALRRLALLLETDADSATRLAPVARLVAQLWAMVQKGRAVLEARLEEGDSAEEADAIVEELLGKVWQLSELKEKGFVKTGLTLVELAYARGDDAAREERIETSHLLDLGSGDVLCERALLPLRRVGKEVPKASYDGALQVAEAALYPGFLNRRVRWEREHLSLRPLTADDRAQVVARALPLADAVARFKGQLKNLLAPREAALLVQVARIGRVGDAVAIEDAVGTRLRLASGPKVDAALNALELAGWPKAARAMLVELSAPPEASGVIAAPMTVVSPEGFMRLSC